MGVVTGTTPVIPGAETTQEPVKGMPTVPLKFGETPARDSEIIEALGLLLVEIPVHEEMTEGEEETAEVAVLTDMTKAQEAQEDVTVIPGVPQDRQTEITKGHKIVDLIQGNQRQMDLVQSQLKRKVVLRQNESLLSLVLKSNLIIYQLN